MRNATLDYVPCQGDTISVEIPELGSSKIYVTVLYREGSLKKGKIHLYCKAGPDQESLHLIWKKGTGWFSWLRYKKYNYVRVNEA